VKGPATGRPPGEEDTVKQYLISMFQPVGEGLPDPEFPAEVMRKLDAIHDELIEAGSWVFGNGLHAPETATVLRPKGEEVLVTDGPYVEGKEYLGGSPLSPRPTWTPPSSGAAGTPWRPSCRSRCARSRARSDRRPCRT
jgi:hypothetical protein